MTSFVGGLLLGNSKYVKKIPELIMNTVLPNIGMEGDGRIKKALEYLKLKAKEEPEWKKKLIDVVDKLIEKQQGSNED
jgi:hypothetical protein